MTAVPQQLTERLRPLDVGAHNPRMIQDIPGQITGTLGTRKKIKFRAFVTEHEIRYHEPRHVEYGWVIDIYDPRTDRRGYRCNITSDRMPESGICERQLLAYLEDLDAEIHEKGLESYWAEPEVPVTAIDKEERLIDTGVRVKDPTAAERQRRFRDRHRVPAE